MHPYTIDSEQDDDPGAVETIDQASKKNPHTIASTILLSE